MLRINNQRLKKQYALGGSGILDSISKFIVKTFTSQGAKALASSAAKEIGKAAVDAGKSVVTEAGKKSCKQSNESVEKSRKYRQEIYRW